jgi:hypothetical protein
VQKAELAVEEHGDVPLLAEEHSCGEVGTHDTHDSSILLCYLGMEERVLPSIFAVSPGKNKA